ncbi:MAG: transcription-repair coupling factor [Planctomycetota bacterium]
MAGEFDPLIPIAQHPAVRSLAEALRARRRCVATGAAGSSTTLVAAALSRELGCPVILVGAHIDEADEAEDELVSVGVDTIHLPALEVLPGETGVSPDLAARRLAGALSLYHLAESEHPVILAPIQALMQRLPTPDDLGGLARRLALGDEADPTDLLSWLVALGYRRVDAVEEPGDVALRGGILDVFPAAGAVVRPKGAERDEESGVPVRLDFFGDEIDRLSEVDPDTLGSDRALDAVELFAADASKLMPTSGGVNPVELIPDRAIVLISETLEVVEQGRGYFERAHDGRSIDGPPAVLKLLGSRFHALAEINQFSPGQASSDVRVELPVESLPELDRDAGTAIDELKELSVSARVVVPCQSSGERDRLGEMLVEQDAKGIAPRDGYLHRGFIWGRDGAEGAGDAFALVPYHEILHRFEVRRRGGKLRAGRAMDTFLDIAPGDFVVHQDHGIAKFVGLELLPARGPTTPKKPPPIKKKAKTKSEKASKPEMIEYLTLEFAGSSRLHVPAAQIDMVQKYVGGFSGKPPLSHIGGTKWKNQKAKVSDSVRELAAEMLRVRAAREHLPGTRFPDDTTWQREFEGEFPYTETEDQLAALQEIKKDMSSERPMDRLLCGDVGFGKTEVAIRAAFKACEFGKQVAVLVPTTVLAEQHERTFRQRFAAYPFRVESLSRFKTTKEINATLAAARKGQIDVVIGTHRLLSKDVRFADLGLVVIDEEQRFGVEHKETLLRLRTQVDVLTLSATPIPRTLHMAILGLRDISSLTTPPLDRRSIVTEVIPYNATRVKRAIERELAREGQVYYVHNRVYDIESVADEVQKLAPDARIVIGHGQMEPKQLESVMLKFMRREADILIATTIIESGIDNPTANTMIIDDADRYGLADLHQLRGRVGRYKHRAYCYLLLPADRTVKEVAQKRLKAIEQYSMLGAGFKIAMRDLEIRGAGNILGAEQSGHIAAVGYEMYCRLLEHAVKDLTRAPGEQTVSHTTVDLGVHGVIPRAYIPSDARRLEAYRRLATAENDAAIDQVESDLTSAYGAVPAAVERLTELARIRAGAAQLRVRTVTRRAGDVVFLCPDPALVLGVLGGVAGTVRSVSAALAQTNARTVQGEPLAEVYWRPPQSYLDAGTLLRTLARRLSTSESEPARAARTSGVKIS